MSWIVLTLTLLFASCTFWQSNNARQEGHEKLYSSPEIPKFSPEEENLKRLVIVSTNDMRGNIEVIQEVVKDNHSPQSLLLPVGGSAVFGQYLDRIRASYQHPILLLDAGNWLQGSAISEKSQGAAILEFFQRFQFDAISLAPADLLAGQALGSGGKHLSQWLPKVLANSKLPVLASNLVEVVSGETPAWKPLTPTILKSVNGIKVGIMSLLSAQTPEKIPTNLMNGLYIEDPTLSVLKYSKRLRKEGAEVIVLMTSMTTLCGKKEAEKLRLPLSKVNFDFKKNPCDAETELARLLSGLPHGTIDAVITAGGTHKIANLIHDVPVMQNFGDGKWFSRMEIWYDSKAHEVVTQKTQIDQPTKLCHRFFAQTKDCWGEDLTIPHQQMSPAVFWGQEIKLGVETGWLIPYRQEQQQQYARMINGANAHQRLDKVLAREMARQLVADVSWVKARPHWQTAIQAWNERDLRKIMRKDRPIVTVAMARQDWLRVSHELSKSEIQHFSQGQLPDNDTVTVAMLKSDWNMLIAPRTKLHHITTEVSQAPLGAITTLVTK